MEKLGPGVSYRPLPWNELTKNNDVSKPLRWHNSRGHGRSDGSRDRSHSRQLRLMKAFDNTLIYVRFDNGASAGDHGADGGHDPQAPPGSAASYLCLGPGFRTPATPTFVGTRLGFMKVESEPRWSSTGSGNQGQNELRHTPGHVIDFVQRS